MRAGSKFALVVTTVNGDPGFEKRGRVLGSIRLSLTNRLFITAPEFFLSIFYSRNHENNHHRHHPRQMFMVIVLCHRNSRVSLMYL